MFNWDASKFGRLGGKPYAYGTYGRTFVGSGRNKLQSSPVSQEVGLSEGAILSSMLVHLFRSLLLRLNTGAPKFFLISLNSTRNRHCHAIAEQVATVLDMLITAVRQGELDVLGPDKPTARF